MQDFVETGLAEGRASYDAAFDVLLADQESATPDWFSEQLADDSWLLAGVERQVQPISLGSLEMLRSAFARQAFPRHSTTCWRHQSLWRHVVCRSGRTTDGVVGRVAIRMAQTRFCMLSGRHRIPRACRSQAALSPAQQ